MARNLLQALGEGASKTASQTARGAARRALKDIPSSESIYKLGFGIGPMLRNTADSYKQQKEVAEAAKTAKENLNFTKENVVASKNMSSQLTALTSIMSDIRKISLAHLSLARLNAKTNVRRVGSPDDRGRYLDLERQLETVRGTPIAATTESKDRQGINAGLFGAIGGGKLAAGLLGLLALANAKEIGQFLKDTGVSDLVKQGTIEAVKGLANLLATSLNDAITKSLPSLLQSVKDDISKLIDGLQTGNKQKIIEGATGATSTLGGLAGAAYGFKKGKTLKQRLGLAAFGGLVGFGVPTAIGEQATEATSPSGSTPEERAANKEGALSTLGNMAEIAALGLGGYGLYKRFGGAGKAVSTATTAATTTVTNAVEAARSASGIILPESAGRGARTAAQQTAMQKAATGSLSMADRAAVSFARTMDLMAKVVRKIGLKKLAVMIATRVGTGAAAGAAAGAWGGPIAIITALVGAGLAIWQIYEVIEAIYEAVEQDEKIVAEDAANPNGQSPAGTTVPANTQSGVTPATTPAGTSTAPQATTSTDYANPLPSGATGSKGRFGEEREGGRLHKGVDISAPIGTPVSAIADGKVFAAGSRSGYGNMIEVHHDDGTISRYAHLSAMDVNPGSIVKKGQIIGKVGNSGQSEGPHLHLEIINKEGKFVNPRNFISGIPAYSGKDSGRNPEGSLSTIDAQGVGTTTTGTAVTPPSPSNAFQSIFGFDPSKMGVNLNEMVSGKELKELNELATAMTTQPQVVVMPQPTPQGSGQAPSSAPAPQRTPDNTQTKEKDYLWIMNSGPAAQPAWLFP